MKKTEIEISAYHRVAIIYFMTAALAGISISDRASSGLQAEGPFIFHAYIAFMGFGTLMILGQQKAFVHLLLKSPGIPAHADSLLFRSFNISLWSIWLSYLLEGLTGNCVFYYIGIIFGFVILICLALFAYNIYAGVTATKLLSNIPLRFLATSLFMCFLAYGQLIHVTINTIKPILPFAEAISLKTNYLAFSFPISLTIMGTLYIPYFKEYEAGRIRSKALWEAQYAILVSGVFALFGAILFDSTKFHHIFATLQFLFSFVLVMSIVVFAAGVIKDRKKTLEALPDYIWRYFASAIFYLSLAGLAGLALGYGFDNKSAMFYFLIQGHIHLALLGWAGMGITGALIYLMWTSGRFEHSAISNIHYVLMHLGIIIMCIGIYFKSGYIRGVAGLLLIISAIIILKLMTAIRNSYAP